MEVLDLHNGNQANAKRAIVDALYRICGFSDTDESLVSFDNAVHAACMASFGRAWWRTGLQKLADLGLVTIPA